MKKILNSLQKAEELLEQAKKELDKTDATSALQERLQKYLSEHEKLTTRIIEKKIKLLEILTDLLIAMYGGYVEIGKDRYHLCPPSKNIGLAGSGFPQFHYYYISGNNPPRLYYLTIKNSTPIPSATFSTFFREHKEYTKFVEDVFVLIQKYFDSEPEKLKKIQNEDEEINKLMLRLNSLLKESIFV